MVITVVTVWMMKMTVDQVINVVAVGYLLTATIWTVNVCRIVARALMSWGAGVWIGVRHLNYMLVYMVFVWVMQVSVVEVINVVTMLYCGVSAVRSVDV